MMSVAVLLAHVVPCVAGQDAPALKGNLDPAEVRMERIVAIDHARRTCL